MLVTLYQIASGNLAAFILGWFLLLHATPPMRMCHGIGAWGLLRVVELLQILTWLFALNIRELREMS